MSRFGRDDPLGHGFDNIGDVDSREIERVWEVVSLGYRLAKRQGWIAGLDLGAIRPDGIAVAAEDLG
jgi:hypothetical protein